MKPHIVHSEHQLRHPYDSLSAALGHTAKLFGGIFSLLVSADTIVVHPQFYHIQAGHVRLQTHRLVDQGNSLLILSRKTEDMGCHALNKRMAEP
jgi:hypothetical protein